MKLKDFCPKYGNVRRIYCDKCGKHTVLSFAKFVNKIEGIDILINGLPVLLCEECNIEYLPDRSTLAIMHTFEQAHKKNNKCAKVTRNKCKDKFNFTKAPFIYDPDDYFYIPGLQRRFDVGFLTPVFFNKEVLIKFDNRPNYRVNFASKTYGEIRKNGDFSIPFGINNSNRVIMWLGDIAELPLNEQYYLRSENIDSDHQIGSEFYDAQIEAVFTKLSPGAELIKSRFEFLEASYVLFSKRLSHLDEETLRYIEELKPPVAYSSKEERSIIDLLNKINIESLDAKTLKELLNNKGRDGKDKNGNAMGRLKMLELLYSIEFPDKDIPNILSPLFVVYDLRVANLHLISATRREEVIKSVCERLGMSIDKVSFEKIYNDLILKITQCYRELI